jgi:hypothetical protein
MLLATAKTHFEEKALVASTKQRRTGWLADNAVRLDCFVLCPLLTPCLIQADVLQTNMS